MADYLVFHTLYKENPNLKIEKIAHQIHLISAVNNVQTTAFHVSEKSLPISHNFLSILNRTDGHEKISKHLKKISEGYSTYHSLVQNYRKFRAKNILKGNLIFNLPIQTDT